MSFVIIALDLINDLVMLGVVATMSVGAGRGGARGARRARTLLAQYLRAPRRVYRCPRIVLINP